MSKHLTATGTAGPFGLEVWVSTMREPELSIRAYPSMLPGDIVVEIGGLNILFSTAQADALVDSIVDALDKAREDMKAKIAGLEAKANA